MKTILLFAAALSMQAAIVNVKNFGANGTGGDDTAAIRSAINASGLGDTIQFPAGTYGITSQIALLSNRTYQCLGGATLSGSIGAALWTIPSGGVTITVNGGCVFNGGGILGNGSFQGLTVTGNTFQNITGISGATAPGGEVGAVIILGRCDICSVTLNTFKNIYDSRRVGGWSDQCGPLWINNGANVHLDGNTFSQVCQGMHYSATSGTNNVVTACDNSLHGVARYGIEFQGNASQSMTGVEICRNVYDTPQPGINGQTAISSALGTTNQIVHDNNLSGPNAVNPSPHQSAAIEIEGHGASVYNNTAGHFDVAITALWANPWSATNNVWCDMISHSPTPNYVLDLTSGSNSVAPTANTFTYTSSCAGVPLGGGGGGGTGAGPPTSDEFNQGVLDSTVWAKTLNGGTQAMTGSQLSLTAPAGSNHDPNPTGGGSNNSVRILQTVGTGDFTLEAKFDSVPFTSGAVSYVGEGIIIQQDTSNFLRVEVGSYNSNSVIQFSAIVAGTQSQLRNQTYTPGTATSFWMRIQKAGNVWTQSYSLDGTTFTTLPSFTQALTVSGVGLYAANFNSTPASAPAFTSLVNYFHNGLLPDLTLNKTHTGSFAKNGTGTYMLTVANPGTGPTSGTVTVVDTLPTGLTATSMSGSGWSCTIGTLTCTTSAAVAAAAAFPAITLNVNIGASAPASVTNTATVSGGSDTDPTNDSASDLTIIISPSSPGLTIVKSHGPGFVQSGTGGYGILIGNSGSAATSGTVTVTDTLPTGQVPSTCAGTGWVCNIAGQLITATRSDALAAGSTYPSLAVTVAISSTALSATNTATVTGGGGTMASSSDSVIIGAVNPPTPTVIQCTPCVIRGTITIQ